MSFVQPAMGVVGLVGWLADSGRLGTEERDAAVSCFLRWRFSYVSTSANILCVGWEADGLYVGPVWRGALAVLANPQLPLDVACRLFAGLIRKHWPQMLDVRRTQVVSSVMDSLLRRGNWPATAASTQAALQQSLLLVPTWLGEVRQTFVAWARQRGLA